MQSMCCYRTSLGFCRFGVSLLKAHHRRPYSAAADADAAFQKFGRSIIYSSHLEDNKIHLSHRMKYLLKKDSDKSNTTDRVKPFSVAVRGNISLAANDVHHQSPRQENRSVKKVQNNTNIKSWMSDYETYKQDDDDDDDDEQPIYGTSSKPEMIYL